MTEMSVVLPQPLGPTRKLSSPKRALKSTPRSASILVSPSPKCLRTSWHDTARSVVAMVLTPGRLRPARAPALAGC